MRDKMTQNQSGVALILALSVLVIMSVMLVVILADVQSELQMSAIERNSERALKIAEAGVNIARASYQQQGVSEELGELSSVDGFANGGYFFVHMGSGFPGNEKWVQWHYDASISGNNGQSEITTPLRRVWGSAATGRNGSWRGGSSYYVNNLYPIVAGGAYFPIEAITDTKIRAHDEYTGKQEVINIGVNNGVDPYWDMDSTTELSDKTISNTSDLDESVAYAVRMSPMASYSNLSTILSSDQIAIKEQTIYFTYIGAQSGDASTLSDKKSTVRLRAADALNNPSAQSELKSLWEFDTGLHGLGTAPAFFDPSPNEPGDEIIYFAVVAFPEKNSSGTEFMVDMRGDFKEYPAHLQYGSEQIYLFALVDVSRLGGAKKYRLKWARPFPDPDVNDWTDYPTEQATGTLGFNPPYVRVPADMEPFLPEEDLLFDYRDGKTNYSTDDYQSNQVRGNVYMVFDPQSLSPPVLKVTYYQNNGDLSIERDDAANPAEPLIDIYLAFAAHSRVTGYDVMPYYNSISWNDGILGNKQKSVVQTRVIALRDRLAGSCDSDGKNCSWDWNSAKSRYPVYKWSKRLPGYDPKQDDPRPWNGYGEFSWHTWFEQQVAPMVHNLDKDQDDTDWSDITNQIAGKQNRYTVVYPSYESLGFVSGGANYNSVDGPTTSRGAPVAFPTGSYDDWDETKIMIMGLRDTWDDYMQGDQTNRLYDNMSTLRNTQIGTYGNAYTMPVKSNPVEPYWTHAHDGVVCDTDGSELDTHRYYTNYPTEELITYPQYPANSDKVGWPRPYVWSEGMWLAQIRGDAHPVRNLNAQGWDQMSSSYKTGTYSIDADVEGETSAFCPECLDEDGLIVTVFNHDLTNPDTDREDLRVHAVNAKTGVHVWDYHMPAKLAGDYFNATPAIANNLVFVAYQAEGDSILQVLNGDTGTRQQRITFDDQANVVVIPPTIANGAVYVGSYDFNGNTGDSNMGDDEIRLFVFSPVLRMYATGIYPMSTSLTDTEFSRIPRTERKLQVWISGAESKWEEVREGYQ